MIDRTIAVAPMIDWTDKHCRYFLRLFAPQVLLYTEMITTAALQYGDWRSLLDYHPREQPLALQLGGYQPKVLADCARLAEQLGYQEINLNVGCPSARVQAGKFGVCLMREPTLVAECVAAMRAVVKVPVTVKTRIGVDQDDSYEFTCRFVEIVSQAGCDVFIMHARKAWLQGLSPKENRDIPPLRYEVVKKLVDNFPQLQFVLNGGIKTITAVQDHLTWATGVMIGREAYHNPYFLAQVVEQLYPDAFKRPTREAIFSEFLPYVQQQLNKGVALSNLSRHILGLFQGQPGARAWRRYISEYAHKKNADISVLKQAFLKFSAMLIN